MKSKDIIITPILDTLHLEKISDAEYFSAKYNNYISNSRLGLIDPNREGNAEKFFGGFKPIYSSSLSIGSAVHAMCLQKDLYNIVDSIDLPTGKMGIMAEKLFNKCEGNIPTDADIISIAKEIDYYGGNLSPKRISEVVEKCSDYWNSKKQYLQTRTDTSVEDLYLDPKSREIAYNCIAAVENNKSIQNLLKPKSDFGEVIFENEQAILLDVLVEIPSLGVKFILKLKSKLDNYTIDTLDNSICINDIKTLGKIVSEMPSNIERFRYNREIAMYSWLLSLCAKKFYNVSNPTIRGNYLVVSTIPNYYTKVLPMTKSMFIEGWYEFVYLLKLVALNVATKEKYKDFGIWNIKS